MDPAYFALDFLHVVLAGAWIGGALFLDLVLAPKLTSIPPTHGATLATAVGTRFTYVSWTGIIGLVVTGLVMVWIKNGIDVGFLFTLPEGAILLAGMLLTLLPIANGLIITFVLRPKLSAADANVALNAVRRATTLIRVNTISGIVIIVLMVVFAETTRW